jgi:hypothetical protein
MSYEQLKKFSNDKQLYRTFEDEDVINNWALQRDVEVSKRQNGGISRSLSETKTKIQKLRISTKRQRMQDEEHGNRHEAETYDDNDDCSKSGEGVEEQDDDNDDDDDDDDDSGNA